MIQKKKVYVNSILHFISYLYTMILLIEKVLLCLVY